ncbi:MAG: type 1 glutamine amidotransferase domain-containing protein [Planctomycetota bacterium]
MTKPNRSILLLTGTDYEDLELHYPRLRLREAGYWPVVAGPSGGATYLGKHGYPSQSDRAISDVEVEPFAGIVLPGGWMPDKLRRDTKVQTLVKAFDAAGKLIASICHGPWICISAGVVRGRRYTGSPGIQDDLVNAGAQFTDAPVVVDEHHVSSRRPDDLPEFCAAILGRLAEQAG